MIKHKKTKKCLKKYIFVHIKKKLYAPLYHMVLKYRFKNKQKNMNTYKFIFLSYYNLLNKYEYIQFYILFLYIDNVFSHTIFYKKSQVIFFTKSYIFYFILL